MECKINKINKQLDDQLEKLGLENDKLILASEAESLLPTLGLINKKYKSSGHVIEFIGEITNPDSLVKVQVSYPLEEASDDGGNVKNNSFDSLTRVALEEAVGNKKVELDEYFEEALSVLRNITSSSFNNKLGHLTEEVRQDLKALRTRVLAMDDTQKLEGISAFIAEASVVSQRIREQMSVHVAA